MTNRLLFGLLLLFSLDSIANTDRNNVLSFQEYEDTLKVLAVDMLGARGYENRKAAHREFVDIFEEALEKKGSFNYSFDSLNSISFLYPEDRSFRIITWQICEDSDNFDYYGYIQMNDEDQTLIKLKDKSDDIRYPEKDILSAKKWYGALYYNIKQVKHKRKTQYILFGFDANTKYVRKKILDVLTFKDGKPSFGAPVFQIQEMNGMTNTQSRFFLEYGSHGAVTLNYNENNNMIMYDNLIPMGSQYQDEQVMMVTDGSYRGLKYKKGKWWPVVKIFSYVQEEAPRGSPILDDRKGKSGLFGPGVKN